MAGIAAVNLGFVLFNLSYVPWRNFWLQGVIPIPLTEQKIRIPMPKIDCPDRSVKEGEPARIVRQSAITCLYDPIKGIEPYRDTQSYLNTVDQLQQQVQQTGVQSAASQKLLQTLADQSEEMIQTNPFQVANKSGTLEKIKDRMRRHIYSNRRRDTSSRQAFRIFWIERAPANWATEMAWFNQEIRPLIETNYFRTIEESGQPTDNFWLIDAPFVVLFGLEFLARTYYLSRRHRSISWLDAMLWRWYDLLLLQPIWRWLRVIPVAIRLDQARLVSLARLREQTTRGLVASIAEEMAEVVVVQVINRTQDALRQGDLVHWLSRFNTKGEYIDLNQRDEIAEITAHLLQLIVQRVLPKIRPDLAALLRHNIEQILNQSPAYRGLQTLPGISGLSGQVTDRLVNEVIQATYDVLTGVVQDRVGAELGSRVVRNFADSLVTEVRQERSLKELQPLLTDLLEEVKLNYVQRLETQQVDVILEENRRLQQIARSRATKPS